MHDYQLERLSARSFEQLVQALAAQSLGHKLSFFGDCADGGCDAIFQGPVAYPTVENPWNGRGIVQAKFRQQPDRLPASNADWVLEQVRRAFATFTEGPQAHNKHEDLKRSAPQYYIFATNVSLNAGSPRGGEDGVRTLLDGYKASQGLKDYAIWDGDQIRRMIDDHPDIRAMYLGWLLPGDVLTEMVSVMDSARPDFVKTLRRFIQCELLENQFARLTQGGYGGAKNIALSSVFLDLPLKSAAVDEAITDDRPLQLDARGDVATEATFLSFLLREANRVLRPSARQPVTLKNTASRAGDGRIVLMGGPGQGKTTLGQFACQLYRAELLRGGEERLSIEITQALHRIEALYAELPAVGGRRYPLRVDLNHFAAWMASHDQPSRSLLDYLARRIATRTNTALCVQDLRQWLGAYPWLLVLDGLDEVPASSNRPQVMQAIREFIDVDAHEADADLLVLVTTRPQGYSDEFSPRDYRHVVLSPLESHHAMEYGVRLARALHPEHPMGANALMSSLRRAIQNPATTRLMQSPLQVTIMVALIEGGGAEPPEQRWRLFRDYYEVICRRERERSTVFSELLGTFARDIRWIHHRVGWILQQRNAAMGSTDALMTHEEFAQLIEARLFDSGHEDAVRREDLVQRIRHVATDRLVFLIGSSDRQIGFEIRSLQEFMAAEHFFDGGDSCVHQALDALAPLPYWRNVFLFMAGRIFFEHQMLIDSVLAVCAKMNESVIDAAQGAVRAGSRLAVALLREGIARNQPAATRVMARIAAPIFDVCDEVEGSLTDLFVGAAEDVLREELTRRLAFEGGQFPRHFWRLCVHLAASGKAWAKYALIMHYPWSRSDALKLMSDLRAQGVGLPEPVSAIFSKRILEHPVSVLSTRTERAHAHPDGARESLPVRDAGRRDQVHDRWALRINGELTGVTLCGGGPVARGAWASVDYPRILPASAHSDWFVVQAASNFAAEPTQAMLLRQLHRLESIDLNLEQSALDARLPWQISLCIAERCKGVSWSDIIARIEAGALGTQAEWRRWEASFEAGIDLERCRTREPWGVSDQYLGLITRECGWSYVYSLDEVLSFARVLSTCMKSHKDQQPLIRLCSVMLSRLAQESPTTRQAASIKDFLDACVAAQVRIPTALLFAIVLSDAIDSTSCAMMLASAASGEIEDVGAWGAQIDAGQMSQKVSAAIDAGGATDRWRDMLVSISRLPPLEAWRQIAPSRLYELSLGEATYTEAANRLMVGRLDWAASEAEAYARRALEADAATPTFLSSVLDRIESAGAGPHLEGFLVGLLHQANALEVDHLARVMTVLIKLLTRRPASTALPDPASRGWSADRRIPPLGQAIAREDPFTDLELQVADSMVALRREFIERVPMLTSAEVHNNADDPGTDVSQSLLSWRRGGKIFGVNHGHRDLYPAFQFGSDGRPLPIVAEVLAILNSDPERTDWDNALWFAGDTGWLDGKSPIECLQSDPAAVKRAAEQEVLRDEY